MKSWQERLADKDPNLRVHLMGIGGAGLSAIATVLLEMGIHVSGSDPHSSANTERLKQAGAMVYPHQVAANLTKLPAKERPHVLLISSAIRTENPEYQAAETLGIPIVKRSQFLPILLQQRQLVAVAGTHGKSTTTAMVVKILRESGIDVGYIIGTDVPRYGNASAGSHLCFVLEADEYDHMFLGLTPHVAVITNVEWDHPDCYPTAASFRRAFMQFADSVGHDGLIISCADDPGAEELRFYGASRGPSWVTYGTHDDADLRAFAPEAIPGSGHEADLYWWQALSGRIQLQVPGIHNLRNALAAIYVGSWLNVPIHQSSKILRTFQGTARRFELKGEVNGITVIDDYAHHPTEIEVTLAAAHRRYPQRRIWAIFQPHTFSRTALMLERMGRSFDCADKVLVTDIYASRESDNGSVHASDVVAASQHPSIRHVSKLTDVADHLLAHTQAGDVVITLGAGDSYRVGEMLLEQLKNR